MPCTYIPGSVPPGMEDVLVAVVVDAPCACFPTGLACESSGLPRDVATFVTVERLEEGGNCFASCKRHAIALSRRMREASLTRRLKRGSVARVRKVSFRILEYAGEGPRWMSER